MEYRSSEAAWKGDIDSPSSRPGPFAKANSPRVLLINHWIEHPIGL